MRNHSLLFYLMALTRVDKIGPITARKILQQTTDLETVFKNPKEINLGDIGNVITKNISTYNNFALVDKELKFAEKNNIHIISILDKEYPKLLLQCPDAPIILFVKGKLNTIDTVHTLSVVGTRNISTYGTEQTKEIIQSLVPYKPAIFSGFAFGVDICAHLEAIENNLPTHAVLGHGLQMIYPAMHKKYTDKILENGTLISEFWSSDTVSKENFIKRNRIVAGISQATLVIESAIKGGSLSTAKIANDYNREVFAVPGRNKDRYSEGCNYLIKTNQAQLLTSVEDIIYYLNWKKECESVVQKNIQPQLFLNLTDEEQKIYDYLKEKEMENLDVISINLQIPLHKLAIYLLQLELKGLIKPLPGKSYKINL